MNLSLQRKHTTFKNPSPQERVSNLASIKMWLFDKWNYEPHLHQLPFHLAPERFRLISAGTRGGKSKATGEEIAAYLFTGAVRVWIVGQNYSLTSREFQYVYDRMNSQEVFDMFGYHPCDPAYGGKIINNPDQGNMHIKTVWGAEVECISLERAAGAFGQEIDLLCFVEPAQIRRPKLLYEQMLYGRLASRRGDVIIAGTPGGKSSKRDLEGWLYSMYLKGYDKTFTEYYTGEWPSWANPTFTEDPYEIRSWMNPLIFEEQYCGKFITMSGTVFDKFKPEVHVVAPFQPPAHWRRYESIDPGFSGKFVWLSSVMSESGTLYINDEYSDSEKLYEQRYAAIVEHRAHQYNIHADMWDVFQRKHNVITLLYVDSEDPQCMAELSRLGLPNLPANKKDILVSVDRVQRNLYFNPITRPKLYVTSNCSDTIEALTHHGWGDKGLKGRVPANDQYKHWGDTIRYICGGTLIKSDPPRVIDDIDENTYWAAMLNTIGDRTRHPHDMIRAERVV